MIKFLFLVLVAATYLAKGGDLKDQTTLQKSTSQVIQVLIFFQELARTLISESFDQETMFDDLWDIITMNILSIL